MNEENNIKFTINFINEYLKENKNIFYNNLLEESIIFPKNIIEKIKYLINNLTLIRKFKKIQYQKIYDILENYSKFSNNNSDIQEYLKKFNYFYYKHIIEKYTNIKNKLESKNFEYKDKNLKYYKFYKFYIFYYLYFFLKNNNEKENNFKNNNFPFFYLNFLNLYNKCKTFDDINNFYIEIVVHIYIKFIIESDFNKEHYKLFLDIFNNYLLNLEKNKKEVKTIKCCFICLLLGYILLKNYNREDENLIEEYKKLICDILFENFYLKNFLVDIICGNFFDSIKIKSSEYISRNLNLLILSDKDIYEKFGHVDFFKLILKNQISFYQFLLIKDFNNINIIKELYDISLYFFNLQSDIVNKKYKEIKFNDSIKFLNTIFLQNILYSLRKVIISSEFIIKKHEVINSTSEIIKYCNFYENIYNFLDNYIEINENYKIEWNYIINIIYKLKECNKFNDINYELLNKITINFEKIINFNNKETLQKFEYLFKDFKINNIEPYLTIYLNRIKTNNIFKSDYNEFFLQTAIYDNSDLSFTILKDLIKYIKYNKNREVKKIENLIIEIYSNIISKLDKNNIYIYNNLDNHFFNIIISFFYYMNDNMNISQAIKVFLYSKRNEKIFLKNYFLFIINIIWILNYSFNKNKMKLLIKEIFDKNDENMKLIIEILLKMKIKNKYEIHIKKELNNKELELNKISKIPILRLKNDNDENDIIYPFVPFDYYEILNMIINNNVYFLNNKKNFLFIILKNIKQNSFNEKNIKNLILFLKKNIKNYLFDNNNLTKNKDFFLFNKILKFINYRLFFDKADLINLKLSENNTNDFSKIQIFQYYFCYIKNISNNFNESMINKEFFIIFDNFIYYINSLYNDETDILLVNDILEELYSILKKFSLIFDKKLFIFYLKIIFLCFNLKSYFIKLNDENLIFKFFSFFCDIYVKVIISNSYEILGDDNNKTKNFIKIYSEIFLLSFSELIKEKNDNFLDFINKQFYDSSNYLKEIIILILLYKIKNRFNIYDISNILSDNSISKIYMSKNEKKILFSNYNNENKSYDLFFFNLTSILKYNLYFQKNKEFICSEDEKLKVLNDELNIKDNLKTSLKNENNEINKSIINFDNNSLKKYEKLMNTFSLLLKQKINYSSEKNFNLKIFSEFEKNNKRIFNINITYMNWYIYKKKFNIDEEKNYSINYINFLNKIGDIKIEKNINDSYINYENNFYNLCIFLNKKNNINFESISIIYIDNFNFNFDKIKNQLFNYYCSNFNDNKNYYIILVIPFSKNIYRIKICDYYSNLHKTEQKIDNIKFLKNYILTNFLIDISLSSGRNYLINTIIFLYEFNNFLFEDSSPNLFNERIKILNNIFSNNKY